MREMWLLATGAEFVNKKGLRRTQPVIEEMIKNVDKEIHILNYKFGPEAEGLWDMLKEVLAKGKRVMIIANDLSEQIESAMDRLNELNNEFGRTNFTLYNFVKPDGGYLHAKVIVADRERMVIGSANLSKGGLRNHYEMGVHIEGEEAWTVADVIEQIAQNKELCTIVPPNK